MLRLATPDYLRFCQSDKLNATFGGGEDDWADEVEENGYVASGSAKASKPRDEESWDEDDEEGVEFIYKH